MFSDELHGGEPSERKETKGQGSKMDKEQISPKVKQTAIQAESGQESKACGERADAHYMFTCELRRYQKYDSSPALSPIPMLISQQNVAGAFTRQITMSLF
ncbi:hypothetical protein PoB_000643800 [Plakobranchus ocellatus]|uniref:Uncharacterized protein n=1 Tax=Plakobranchus ocellatus TaxID=259542 RepID=A0AAV3YBX8_9GAST|nr:hypothetical protein PoB_000643800 [Plakobranchus ocellatus]